jgi:hypothetical protein
MLRRRPARRLLVAAVILASLDIIEPRVLSSLEARRYEDLSTDFRFENSDLFGVGPLIDYLREHPGGRQPRVMFLGNSVTYGYGLSAADAVPGQFQRLDRSEKIFNAGVNGLESGSAYLIAKASRAAVNHIYILTRTTALVSPTLARRIPVDPDDAQRFGLPAPTGLERSVAAVTNRWGLYRDAYRMQAALFGTSSRQFLYLNKGAAMRGIVAAVRAAETPPPQSIEEVEARTPVASSMPTPERLEALRLSSPLILRQLADVFRAGPASVVVLQVPGFADWLPDTTSVADFNRAYGPHLRIVMLDIPRRHLEYDGMHLTAAGAATTARALWRERQANEAMAR